MKRTTAAERARLVAAYKASNETQEAFAARHGLKVATLQSWLYRPDRKRRRRPSVRFVEVAARGLPDRAPVVLRVGNDVVLELDTLPPPAYLAELARGRC